METMPNIFYLLRIAEKSLQILIIVVLNITRNVPLILTKLATPSLNLVF